MQESFFASHAPPASHPLRAARSAYRRRLSPHRETTIPPDEPSRRDSPAAATRLPSDFTFYIVPASRKNTGYSEVLENADIPKGQKKFYVIPIGLSTQHKCPKKAKTNPASMMRDSSGSVGINRRAMGNGGFDFALSGEMSGIIIVFFKNTPIWCISLSYEVYTVFV